MVPRPADVEKARPADLRPADHEDIVRGERVQPVESRLVIDIGGMEHRHAEIGGLIVHVDKVRMPARTLQRQRDQQIRPKARRRHGVQGNASALNRADQNRTHIRQPG